VRRKSTLSDSPQEKEWTRVTVLTGKKESDFKKVKRVVTKKLRFCWELGGIRKKVVICQICKGGGGPKGRKVGGRLRERRK